MNCLPINLININKTHAISCFGILTIFTWLFFASYTTNNSEFRISNKEHKRKKSDTRKAIRIMSWNARYTNTQNWFAVQDFKHCSKMKRKCVYSTKISSYNKSDVILLDSFYLSKDKFPKYRLPGQKWVFHGYESPDRTSWPKYGVYDSWYNVTMGFTSDSDIFTPYGICVDTQVSAAKQKTHVRMIYGNHERPYLNAAKKIRTSNRKYLVNLNQRLQQKHGGSVWIVSHCKTESKREYYVKALQKYTSVHVYGRCGKGNIQRGKENNILNGRYRFYLAFENTLCEEYATEKLFRALTQQIVPIVLGYVNYTEILPPHSFIDVKDYNSAAHLGRYLNYLSKNQTAYAEYFAWKDRYVCFNNIPWPSIACRVCKFLNNNYYKTNVVKSISEFWSKEKRCKSIKNYYNNMKDVS